jgi:murein DD-endopeptidase MepM/ murein hydrolase activator NlpD
LRSTLLTITLAFISQIATLVRGRTLSPKMLWAVMLSMSITVTGSSLQLAHGAPPSQSLFLLPFDVPPGPSTWHIIQFYGNTRGAYRRRTEWYGSGQGLHFGIDFAARCGTQIVAIGDGEVTKVDASRHGAGPHNLMILHPNGYASFYGHLLERSPLAVGEQVHAGQPVGLTGDPDLSCTSRPHLHLEIRNAGYSVAYNPVALIDADWNSLALYGGRGVFERDLENPRRWVSIDQQPDVDFGGPLLNNYAHPWPPDWD